MTTIKSMICLSAVAAAAVTLTPRGSLAEDTKATSAHIFTCEFRNAPVSAVVDWVARLTREPVVVPYNVNFPVTYRTKRKLTLEEAMQAFDGIFQTNGCQLVKADGAYYRIVKVAETNSFANHSHIDLEIQGDKLIINGNTIIDRNDLAKTLTLLSNAGAEIWVRHPIGRPGAPPSNNNDSEAVELLASVPGLDANKMFLKYVPETK